ncbi:PDZ domain-containing protein [Patescibacteria group bacterium]|nr:PDZ domain-containing protein [Patescibacteria group bacterium]MBU1757653.1 PDZ domain-containing protein [Patescibacteria group bacterium]
MQENDIIIAIDDITIDSYTPFLYQLYTHTPGDTVNLSVLREGNVMRIPVALGKNQ